MVSQPAQPTPGTAATRERILDAAVELAAETGLRKLSMDEIADRAGISRATLYLHLPGKQALLDAAVQRELHRFFDDMRGGAARIDDPRERVVHAFATGYRWLRDHQVLKTILRINPQILLPYVLGDAVAIDLGRTFVAELVTPADLSAAITRDEFAEHVVREFHSLILAPSKHFDLDRPGGPESYARRFLLPLMG